MKRFIKSAIACIAAVAMIATVAPVTTQAAAKKPVVVKTQAQLEKAIKAGATNITIKTDKKVAITIPATKKAAKVAFTVNAPKASIENKTNNGKGLEIKNAASFKESGRNSAITIATKKDITVTVAKASKGADIKVTKANANLTVKANGILNSVSLEAKGAQLAIKGSNTNSIDITAKAANTTIATAVPADITVAKGASVASVEVQAAGVAVSMDVAGTVADVKVAAGAEGAKLDITASGTVGNVTVDAKADVAVAGTTEDAVKVTVNAEGASVKAETAVETTLNADAKVDLGAGAEGSKLTTGEGVTAEVTNGTTGGVTMTDSTGKETTVEAGKTETKEDPKQPEKKPETPSTPAGPTGPTGPTYYPRPSKIASPTAITIYKKGSNNVLVERAKFYAASGTAIAASFGGIDYSYSSVVAYIDAAYATIPATSSTTGNVTISGMTGSVSDLNGVKIDWITKSNTIIVSNNHYRAEVTIVNNTEYKIVGENISAN